MSMIRTISFSCCLAITVLHSTAAANPANRQAASKYYGNFLAASLRSCVLCHVRADGAGAESLEDFPHNDFGTQLSSAGDEVPIAERLARIADQDADQDGVSNLREILAGSAPGRADDLPTDKARGDLPARLAAFEAFLGRYDWQPFAPVQRPEVPEVTRADWVRNPIDAFVAAQHDAQHLQPRPEAPPEILLRRLYLDLTGLSPTPAQVRQYLEDAARNSQAYEDSVQQLLDSPAYGERWARHWMDIWRYSDWAGYKQELRESQRHIWHWRDWIIESLNADKGYDLMVQQMLAADEMDLSDPRDIRATGYLARNYFRNRDQWMDNVVKHTSQAFLGVTVGCAKCHDHMYDAIPQTDYYAMRAIFEPYNVRTDRVPGVLDTNSNGIPRAYDASAGAKTWLFTAGDERRPVRDAPIAPGVPRLLGGTYEAESVALPLASWRPDRRDFVRQDLLAEARRAVERAATEPQRRAANSKLAALQAEFAVEALEDAGEKNSPDWQRAAEQLVQLQRQADADEAAWKLSAAQSKLRSAEDKLKAAEQSKNKAEIATAKKNLDAAKKANDAAQRAADKASTALKAEVTTDYRPRTQTDYPATSSGRRLAFANWLTHEDNPLTARVAVNHIWLRHFGVPLVPTPNDFGGNGREPTHPALLDWLAAELVERDWSMKELHRLIVTSATYRMSTTSDPDNLAVDRDNVFLWRMPSKRMEGEIVRDNLLHVAGRLDTTLGGPDIDHTQAQTSTRRSIYLRHAHEKLVEFVQIFDGPAVSECYMREETIQPQQALALANSPLTLKAAAAIARSLQDVESNEQFVREAFLRVLARFPKPAESEACHDFLTAEKAPAASRRRNMILVLLNHNDFVTIR